MLGGGSDLQWLAPLDEDGNRNLDLDDLAQETVGCHVGPYAGLNVVNPQPEFEYSWANNRPDDLLIARHHGGQVVQSGDPEMAAYSQLVYDGETPVDSAELFPGVVMIRTPTSRVRERREREQAKADAMLTGGQSEFENKTTQGEEEYANLDGRGPTRFTRREHHIEFEDHSGRVTRHWRPGDGIMRRR